MQGSQPYEREALVATIDPQTISTNDAVYSDAVDMSKFSEALIIFNTGDCGADTITFGVHEGATTAAVTNITGKQPAALAGHATSNDNKQVVVNLKAEELTAGCRYMRASITTSSATNGIVAGVNVLARSPYQPTTLLDLASVVEVVT